MTGDNSDTTLALGVTPTSENAVQVYIDGTYQNKDTYSISGETLTFSTAPPTGTAVEAITHTITDISAAASNILVDEFTGDGSDTTFTLSAAPTNENNTQVFVGGVYQEKATYSISNAVLTFSTAPANGVSIEVVSIAVGQINSAVQLADADGDTKVMVEESSDEDKIRFDIAGTEEMVMDATGIVINDGSNDRDFRIESNGNANRFFIDGGTNSGEGAVVVGHNASLGQERVFQVTGTTPDTSGMEMFKYSNDATGPTISLTKSRGGSIGTAASVSDNDVIGAINWFADDGTDTSNYAATIHAEIDGTPGSNDTPGALVFSTTADGSNSVSERMRIDSSGNVGIGTTSPAIGLDIVAANNSQLRIDSSDTNDTTFFLDYNGGGATNRIRMRNAAGDLAFNVSNTTETMRIDSSGRYGFNATYPPTSAQFMRIEEELSSNRVMRISNRDNGAGGKTMEIGNADNNQGASIITAFHGNNVSGASGDPFLDAVFDLQVNGSISIDGTLSEGSDRRLKKDIANSTYGLAAINQLIPRTYKHRDVSKEMLGTQIGFIADEVESVIPEVISKFGLKADGSTLSKHITGYGDEAGTEETFDSVKTLNYERLVVVLTKALQEADDKIDALTARITTLEGS
jgi:hypothetical protein